MSEPRAVVYFDNAAALEFAVRNFNAKPDANVIQLPADSDHTFYSIPQPFSEAESITLEHLTNGAFSLWMGYGPQTNTVVYRIKRLTEGS